MENEKIESILLEMRVEVNVLKTMNDMLIKEHQRIKGILESHIHLPDGTAVIPIPWD